VSDENDDSNGAKLPAGRLSRLARMASLTARTAGDLAIGRARRAMGDDSYAQEKAAAQKVLETLGTMKGVAMKLGQQLAMEADTLPPEAREIVSKLFAQAPAMSYDDIALVVQEELGDPPDVAFAWFDRTPLASASLGQVHRARLPDGTECAVKVQYPGVAEALVNDLKNAGMLARALNGATRAFAAMDSGPYFEEIRREIGAEIDYVREARLGEAFARSVAGAPELRVPRAFPAYSSSRVLTMEFIEGVPLKDFAGSDADAATRWRVGRQLAQAILVPFVTHGLVHGDPHPGNFLVCPDGRLAVLDFGAVKQLSPRFVRGFWGLMVAELEGRTPDFIALLTSAGFTFKGDLDKARQTLAAIHGIAARPVLQETYDWGACTMVPDLRRHFLTEMRGIFEVQPPPESLLFYRALGGLANNLRALRSSGPYRALCSELTGLLGSGGDGGDRLAGAGRM
jgi:predicted unusual protein kinase regulating ubiquinone biosynthesis (AarF/ABC1/UbiB family)